MNTDNIKITLDNERLMVTAAVDGIEGLERLIVRLKAIRSLFDATYPEPVSSSPAEQGGE